MRPYSLYIHIPFCIKKCAYCDFLSFEVDDKVKNDYVEALCHEIKAYALTSQRSIDTIFIGGGTPTALSAKQLEKIINCVTDYFYIERHGEFSIEANPKTVSDDIGIWLQDSIINRVSLGLQSVHEHHLKSLSRIHTYRDFLDTYHRVRKAGISNINVDLMFGLPNQTFEEWIYNLEQVVTVNPDHISAYGLIIEEHTPFYRMYQNGSLSMPDEALERKMYHFTKLVLEEHDFERYEISNYAKKGYECQHNLGYWTDKDYIGVGLGASSYIQGRRYKNIEDLDEYIKHSSRLNQVRQLTSEASLENMLEERIFLGLRMMKGINLEDMNRRFNHPFENIYKKPFQRCREEGLIIVENGQLKLTDRGIDVSNYVFSQFMLD